MKVEDASGGESYAKFWLQERLPVPLPDPYWVWAAFAQDGRIMGAIGWSVWVLDGYLWCDWAIDEPACARSLMRAVARHWFEEAHLPAVRACTADRPDAIGRMVRIGFKSMARIPAISGSGFPGAILWELHPEWLALPLLRRREAKEAA